MVENVLPESVSEGMPVVSGSERKGMTIFRHPNGITQELGVCDLIVDHDYFFKGRKAEIVYSDPPWSPGNEKWWRRHAGKNGPKRYDDFLISWCTVVSTLTPDHIFCEQSINKTHRDLMIDAITKNINLPLIEEWTVCYGNLRQDGSKKPNVLLHFGHEKLLTNPSGMSGVSMTRTVFNGLNYRQSITVADPCIGKGMVSRLAHEKQWNCIGTELNGKRLNKTIGWLLKHGYKETQCRVQHQC